jgi:hypothetical protein
MAEFSNPTQWAGAFKRVYSDKGMLELIPDNFHYLKRAKFKIAKKIGDTYEQPVMLSVEQGITRGGSGGDAYALKTAVTGDTGNARVSSYEMTLRGRISKATLERSKGSEASFINGTKFKVKSMAASHSYHQELDFLYGASVTKGIGEIESQTGSGTTRAFVITAASWAPGIWMGRKGMNLDCHTASNSTKLNTTAAIVVVSVNLTTRTVNVSGVAAELDAAVAGKFLFAQDMYASSALGLDGIALTASGNLHGLSTDNDVWKPSTYDVGSVNLGFGKIVDALNQAWERGLEGDAQLTISGKTFAKLNISEAALRKYDMSYKKQKASNGFENFVFTSHSGDVEVVVHRMVKQGEGFLHAQDSLVRVGAYDGFKFDDVEEGGQVMFYRVPDYNGYELRTYSDQAPFCEAPSQLVKLYNIVNS